MVNFQFNHHTGQWDSVNNPERAANTFVVPALPGDPPQYLEIPAKRARDPGLLSILAKYRPALMETSVNTSRGVSPANGRKRSIDADDENEGEVPLTHNCDQIRRKIRNLIDSGMKVTEFAEAISVSTPAYYRFMTQNGPQKGSGSDTYINAMRYFQKMERGEMPVPAKKAKTTPSTTSSTASVRSVSAAPSNSSAGPSLAELATAHAAIPLDGEMSDSVAVYDTCDEIRRKINTYLQKSTEPQASFLRTLMAQYHTQTKNIQSVQLQRYRNMKGPDAGNTNPVYYAAYVFFEKERLRMGKAKTETRKKMESIYPHGMDVERASHRKGVWTAGNSSVSKNQYGQWVIDGRVIGSR